MSGPEKRPCRNARRKGCGLRGISPENREYGNGRPVFPFLGKTYLIDFHSSENHLSCQDSSGAETPLPEGRAGLFFRAAHAGKGPFFPCCAPCFRQGAETGLLPEKARAHGKTGGRGGNFRAPAIFSGLVHRFTGGMVRPFLQTGEAFPAASSPGCRLFPHLRGDLQGTKSRRMSPRRRAIFFCHGALFFSAASKTFFNIAYR